VTAETFADRFIPHLAPEVCCRVTSMAALAQALDDVLRQARERWPGVQLDDDAFLIFLAERVPVDAEPLEALRTLRVADLFLVRAVLVGDEQAHRIFETQFLPDTYAALARMETTTAQVEDIQQIVCQKLLFGHGDTPPKLLRYAGTGDLRAWLNVIAVRAALDLIRREKTTTELDDDCLADAVSPSEDQELQYIKQLYRSEFKSAFQEAMSQLEPRERNILRHQMLDGLTLDQIAAIYTVHRATVARWNAALREKLLTFTRKNLHDKLNTNRNEFESIMRLIQSRFDVSIRRHLKENPDDNQD
jgi:RNA polymerase sigma-70 factor (ECF subfamily)